MFDNKILFTNPNTPHSLTAVTPDSLSPPYTDQSVATYIWTVRLPLLQKNMEKFPSYEDYQQALLQM